MRTLARLLVVCVSSWFVAASAPQLRAPRDAERRPVLAAAGATGQLAVQRPRHEPCGRPLDRQGPAALLAHQLLDPIRAARGEATLPAARVTSDAVARSSLQPRAPPFVI